RTAAEQFLGEPVEPGPAEAVRPPGRLERRGIDPEEIWDGAHNLAGIGYLLARVPSGRYVIVASILDDKPVDDMLRALSVLGDTLVATTSSNPRALNEKELAARAERYFDHVEASPD